MSTNENGGRCCDASCPCQEKIRSLEETVKQFMTAFAEQESRLRAVENELKDRAFVSDVLESTSRNSEIPTGHSEVSHGGAMYDDVRNQIISISQESNRCRDIFVTHLTDATHGTTEVKKNVIPFNCDLRMPMYDGKRFAYITETGWDKHCCRRFGRLDLESFTFEELTSIPAEPYKMFAPCTYGCYHNGTLYMSDYESQLCGYDVEKKKWRRFGITLPNAVDRRDGDGEGRHGVLMSDPNDDDHLYFIGSYVETGLYRIDFDEYTCTLMSKLPPGGHKSFDSLFVRPFPDSESFLVIVQTGGKEWHMYSSRTNKWKKLIGWAGPDQWCSRNFIVYANVTKTFYYHIKGHGHWEIVQL